MPFRRKPRPARLFAFLCSALAVTLPAAALPAPADPGPGTVPPALSAADPAEAILRDLHPDYAAYVTAIRPMDSTVAARAGLYMVLVRPGATDPVERGSAPFAGSGARNEILYDPAVLAGGRSAAWTRLLLDHEYFHARHVAGATGLPLPLRNGVGIERHFFEAAAWGYTVAEARAGRYPGLREDEFREALDRYGEHYRDLRTLTRDGDPSLWTTLSDPLRADLAVTAPVPPPPAAPWRPSAPGPGPVIP